MATKPKSARRPRPAADPDAPPETKAAKFSRLATARINTAVKKISLIANLSGPGYEYTPDQIDKLREVLQKTVDNTMARFVKMDKAASETIVI